ncbi:MAG: hypothetical protein GX329_07865, partial [Tissierellia bacterium]|nr:hypothetical protein [Tissierellia bacterium]
AKSQASVIDEESKRTNDSIIDSKVREAEAEKKRILSRATSDASLSKERAISNAELRARNEKLGAKQQIIDRVFNMAEERLNNLDEGRYISYIKATLEKLDLEGEQAIVVPKNMQAKVEGLGLQLEVVGDESVQSGFMIREEGTTLNYTFHSLVEHYRDELETEIAQSLFKE